MSTPPEESRRIAALRELSVLDTAPEREFDAAALLAGRLLDKPFAAITFVDRERLWFKAKEGLASDEDVRSRTFCDWTIRSDAVLVVPDAAADPRFASTRRKDDFPVRFYAGTPLHAPSGERIGTLCVGDRVPGTLDEKQIEALEQLGIMVDALIAARATARDAIEIATLADRQAAEIGRQERVLSQAQRMAMIGSWRLPLETSALELSENAHRICGLEPGTAARLSDVLDHCKPGARAEIAQAMARTIETGVAFDLEVDLATIDGAIRRLRMVGEVEIEKGRTAALVGVLQDVTERRALEAMLRRSADTDPLTGLANRAAFERALEVAMHRAAEGGTPLLLALIDLDGFKGINDTHGHTAGDDVLRAVGQRLDDLWLRGSLAARLGGDEFAVIVEDADLARDPDGVAARIEEALRLPVRSDRRRINAGGTVGTALFTRDCRAVREFVHRADIALYDLKRARHSDRRHQDRRRIGE